MASNGGSKNRPSTTGGKSGKTGKTGKSGKAGPSGMSVSSQQSDSSVADRKARRAEAVETMKREQSRRQTRSRLLMASGVVAAVLIVVAVGVYVGLNRSEPASAAGREVASAGVVSDVTGVPASVFDQVGTGNTISAPTATGDGPDLVDGKASFLYVGAEYCPFCAAERWAMAASLARFGTFSGLQETASSTRAGEPFPGTNTLSFYKTTYTSQYVDFKAVETATSDEKPLETLSGDAATTEKKYNYPPYVASEGAGSIPFVDISNAYISSGATYDASVLQSLSHAEIASDMQDPTSDVAKAVDGAANLFTAAICQSTGGQPGDVCNSSGVQAATTALTSASK